MILRTLEQAGITYGDPPIVIPNYDWRVDKTRDPGHMFHDDMLFLLDGNFGSRPLEWADFVEAGTYVQANALSDGNGGWCLHGPDALIVAGRWLDQHPQDMAVLQAIGQASVVASDALRRRWPTPPPA